MHVSLGDAYRTKYQAAGTSQAPVRSYSCSKNFAVPDNCSHEKSYFYSPQKGTTPFTLYDAWQLKNSAILHESETMPKCWCFLAFSGEKLPLSLWCELRPQLGMSYDIWLLLVLTRFYTTPLHAAVLLFYHTGIALITCWGTGSIYLRLSIAQITQILSRVACLAHLTRTIRRHQLNPCCMWATPSLRSIIRRETLAFSPPSL